MKLALYLIGALLVGTLAAQMFIAEPGYVVINFRGYIVEMSVPGLVLVFLLTLLAIWLAIRIVRAPRQLGEAAANFRGRRAGRQFTRGLIEIAEGNHAKGERMLTRGARRADAPLLNYLAAARAAQLQNQDERRDNWLKLAYEEAPEATNAVLLTQAELQIAHEQYEQALATLRQLDEEEAGNGQAVVLLGRLYHRLEDWPQLGKLLPRLAKHKRAPQDDVREWTVRVHQHRLQEVGGHNGDVAAAWGDVPKSLRDSSRLRIAYIEALAKTGDADVAESELRSMLKASWDPTLVKLYGELETSDSGKQLQRAETWLRKHEDDATLLLAAGRLCMHNKLWGKARSYIESSLSIQPTPEAFALFGQLLTQVGESDAAADAYRSGLALVAGDQLRLPGPNVGS